MLQELVGSETSCVPLMSVNERDIVKLTKRLVLMLEPKLGVTGFYRSIEFYDLSMYDTSEPP
jgi:hypothetical protein